MSLLLLASACSDDEALPIDARVVDAAPDAPTDAPPPDGPPTCNGTFLIGACWYKGALGESCTTVCASHGGVSPSTVNLVGASSPGDRSRQAACQQVADALSTFAFNAGVDNVNESDDYGCVEEPDKSRTELVSQNTTVTSSSHVMLARFCACLL